jgi:hypothetical protein
MAELIGEKKYLKLLTAKRWKPVVPGTIFIIVPTSSSVLRVLTPPLHLAGAAPVSSVVLGESGSVGLAGESLGEGREEAAMPNPVIASRSYCGVDRGTH